MQKIKTLIILFLIAIALFFVFYFTHVSPLTIAYGAFLCLIIQTIFLCFYCLFKTQEVYRQSRTISLKRNFQLDPVKDFPFEKLQAKEDFYFNSYTDEAKYIDHKNKIKAIDTANKDEFYFEELQIEEPKQDIMNFLKQIQSYYNSLNIFTDVLVNFGRNLKFIQKSSIFEKKTFYFVKFEEFETPQYPFSEMKQKQMKVLQSARTLPLLSKGQQKKILLPTWQSVIDLMKYIGNQFQKIEAMRRSNSQMLEMIHKKVLQDFSLLQKRLIEVGKQLNSLLKNQKEMRKDYTKYQDLQINGDDNANQLHLQMMQWVKRRYYQFRNLEKKIKENQSQLKERSALRKHFQKKLTEFRQVSQKAFMKTVKTRYIALLDSYHITVDESIRKIQECLRSYGFEKQPPRPKVKNITIQKNVNEALEAEKRYQIEYFQRVDHYLHINEGYLKSMKSLGEFINNLNGVFGQMIMNLKASHMNKYKMASYFTQLTKALLQRSLSIYTQLTQLSQINSLFQCQNTPKLITLSSSIIQNKQKSSQILLQIDPSQGPIKHKYKSARQQIQQLYEQIEQKIIKIKQFQSFYYLHSGRIKKIIVIQFIDFLNYQRQFIAIGNIRAEFNSGGYGLIEDVMSLDQGGSKIGDGKTEGDLYDFQNNNLYVEKPDLSPAYIKFLNQFLFVCFTQWKTSNFFKREISQQLFIAFNKDPNQSFSKIEVSQLELKGQPPQVKWVKLLKSDQKQAFFDINLAFKGGIQFKVNTIYKLIRGIPVEVTIQIQQLYCVIRFCFVPSDQGQGWFSFIGQPISKFKIVPTIANFSLEIQTLKSLFNNLLTGKLKKMTYPIKQKISVPASKKDDDLALIQKRFRAIQEIDAYK